MKLRIILLIIGIFIHGSSYAERYALLVGNNNAKGEYATLKYVENDIQCLRTILSDFCGFEKRHIMTLYNGVPEDLDTLLSGIAARASQTKNTMFLFYFSGHADRENLKMGNAEYSLSTLKEKLTAFPSDIRIGIFDACQSGSFTHIKGGTLSEPFLFKDDGKSKGQVFLSSSSVSENAQEFDAYRNSIFTFHLINALRGSGDVSGDSRVTLSEAYQYAFNHTISSTAGSTGGIQHPSYQFRIQGEGDIVLADLNIRSQGILLDRGLWGAITIFNEQSVVVADLAKEKSSVVMIALSAGNYLVVNVQNGVRLEASVTLNKPGAVAVHEEDLLPVKPHMMKKKGLSAVKNGTQWSVSVAGIYERFNLSSLSSGLNERFREYGYFSISPSFSFPFRTRHGAISIESLIYGRYLARFGGGSFSFSSTADYIGSRLNAFDNRHYASSLHVEKKLSVTVMDAGAGYRRTFGQYNHISLLGGFNVYDITLNMKSIVADSLYNIQASGADAAGGIAVAPYVSVGYSRSITRFFDIGTELRYRYQHRPQSLEKGDQSSISASASIGDGNPAPLKCDFSGFECRMFVRFNYTR